MQKLVFINGNGVQIDLTAGKFGITNWAGLSNTGLNIQTQQVPFEDGGVFLDALMEQREIEITVAIYDGNNLELRYQKKRELISALNPKLGEGTLIYTNDYLSRQIKAVPQIPLFENKNSNDAGTLKASVVFSCPNPYWEDVNYTVKNISQGEVINIENDGDVTIGFEAKIINKINNPIEIENLTTNKSVTIDKNNTNDIVILNTELGRKTLIKRSFVFNQNNGNEGFINFAYSEKEDLFIFTFEHGVYKTTKDFITYKSYNVGADVTLNSVAINETGNNHIYIINSQNYTNGKYYISTDLENWTEYSYPANHVLIKFLNGLNVFYSVAYSYADDGYLYKSTDGINWSECATYGYISPNSICSNTDGSVILASSNITTSAYILKSTDGMESWQVTSGSMNLIISSVFQYNQFWIVYSNGTCSVYDNTGAFVKSENLNDDGIRLVLGYSDKLIIIGNSEHFTTDGINFENYDLPSDRINNLVYSNNNATVYGVTSSNAVMSTKNGYSWYYVYKVNIIKLKSVVYNMKYKRYIGIDNDYSNLYASNNGKNWYILYNNDAGRYIFYNSHIQKTYIIGNNGNVLRDGDTLTQWETIQSGISENLYYGISVNGNVIVTGNSIYLSKNGTSFTEVYDSASRITSIIYCRDKNKYYAVNSGHILQSDNAESWSILSENTNGIVKIVYDTSLKTFVCCSSTAIYKTTDFITFTNIKTISGIVDLIYSEYYECILVLTTSSNSYILYSHDLLTWVDDDERYSFNSVSRLYCDEEKHNIFMLGTDTAISDNIEENIIDTVTGNMGIGLEQGLNDLFITSNDFVSLLLTYRQKYIGV